MLTTSFDVLLQKQITTDLGGGILHETTLLLEFDATVWGNAYGWEVESIALLIEGDLRTSWPYPSRWVDLDSSSPLYIEALAEIERRRDRHDEDWALFLADEGIAPFDPNAEYGTLDARAL